MKTSTKVWLIISIALIFIGLAVFIIAMAAQQWTLKGLNDVEYKTNTYEVADKFNSLYIRAETDGIYIVPSDDGGCRVVCYERENMKHTVEVRDNTLEIKDNDTRKWYERISLFGFTSPKTTVYLPEKSYASLLIDAETGDIVIPDGFAFDSVDITATTGAVTCDASSKGLTKIKLSTGGVKMSSAKLGDAELTVTTGAISLDSVTCEGDMALKVSTGKTTLTDLTCNNLTSDGSTGDLSMKKVVALGSFNITRSTGDVVLNACDAGEIYIKTSTGNVTGTLLSEKIFTTHTSTGDALVPQTTSGGKCDITTSTGDIMIAIQKQ